MPDLSEDLEAYAELAAALADPTVDRDAVLAARGLDEESWAAIDEAWQARIEDDDEDEDDDEAIQGVPPLVAAWAEAFARAQRARALRDPHEPVTFERFIEAMKAIRRGADMAGLLQRLGLTLEQLLLAEQRFTRAMLEDESLAERFRRAMH